MKRHVASPTFIGLPIELNCQGYDVVRVATFWTGRAKVTAPCGQTLSRIKYDWFYGG